MNHTTIPQGKLTQPNWNSTYMSAIAGAAAYFELQYSAPELFVESGYFAATNIQREIKPCGPYCWNHRPVAKNLESMGLCATWLTSSFDCESSEFRKHILDQILANDGDVVCMVGLEFQLLLHRDEQKLVFTLPWGPDVKTCVRELSYTDILARNHFPGLAWFVIKPTTVLPRTTRLRNSIASALMFYQHTQQSEQFDCYFGSTAWEHWATKLESGSYDTHGHWWSSMVWSEARQQAASYFVKEWFGPSDLGKELSTQFADMASVIAKSADREISDSERADFIRQAQDIDTQIYQNLVSCNNILRGHDLN